MNQIISKAEELRSLIKTNEREIDNTILTTVMISELDNLIEYLKDEE